MNVLFVASRDQESLMIQREITLLQQRALAAAGEDVTFHFLPDISVEDLPLELSRHQPDVLHISAHGRAAGFDFANSSGDLVVLKPAALLSLLHPEHPPRLIYLKGAIAPVPRISTKSGPFSPGEWLESLPGSARGY